MKNIGIWLDKEKAHVLTLTWEGETFKTIFSEMEFFNPKGGSGTKSAKWGPQDVVQDSKYLEREKHQMRGYFNKLADHLKEADALAIYGPADTNEKFRKELQENHKQLAAKIKLVAKADSMTLNQVKALIRDFFKK
ncbi:hypothetical protein WIW50_03130 [Flavobacteriaceae bacterium 3-367]|uniref:hypothetical protein n=1 Tax=Eudoraea algarum TaxID=3417568 RepID=UPI003290D0F4